MGCKHCGECCGLIPFQKNDLDRIKKNYKHNFEFHQIAPNLYLHKQSMLKLHGNHIEQISCPFLDKSKEQNKCMIYKYRPEICKKFGVIKELKCPRQ